MAWNCIRKATEEDYVKLEKRAKAFYHRHNLDRFYPLGEEEITPLQLDGLTEDIARSWYHPELRRYWRRIVRRALGHPQAEGIAYGHVGYHVD